MFDQRQNLREAIIKKKARLQRLEDGVRHALLIDGTVDPRYSWMGPRRVSQSSLQNTYEEIAHVKFALGEQEAELNRLLGSVGAGQISGRRTNASQPKARKQGLLEKRRVDAIAEAARLGLRGLDYCDHLDKGGVRVPLAWISRGCPNSYSTAYSTKKWRQRIFDEKSKALKRGRAMGISPKLEHSSF